MSSIHWDPRRRTVDIVDRSRPDGRVVSHTTARNRRGQVVRRTRDDDTLTWEHDAAGRRTSMTLPDGSTVAYAHDDAGRISAVDHPLLGRAAFTHDASGRLVAATADDVVQSWEYADGFVVGHAVTGPEGAVRTVLGRDDEGRLRRVERDGVATTFDYDAACQLIEQRTGDEHVRWRYDTAGRLVSESHGEDRRELTHDAAGQLLSVVGPEGTTTHAYDQSGRRVRTERPDGRTRDLEWSPLGWLATIVDQAGGEVVRTRLHVDASGQLASVDDVAVHWDDASSYAPSLVQVGATPVVTAAGFTGVGEQWTAPGWRTSRSQGEDVWAAASAGTSSRLAGLPAGVGVSPAGELTVAGLEWLGSRVYDAASRGFLSVDPLDPLAGAGWSGNPYAYAGNDPVHLLDPTGLKPVSEADLQAANAPWYEKAWEVVKENKDWIIGGVATIAGVALMATGVGGPAGAMLFSFGTDVLIQKATKGEVNYAQAIVSGAAGGIGAGGSMLIKAKALTGGAKVLATAGVEVGVGTVQGGANYMVGPGPHTPGGFFKASGMGAASSTISAGMGAKFDPLSEAAGNGAARRLGAVIPEGHAADVMDLTNKQILAKNGAQMGVDVVKNAETSVLQQGLIDHDLDGGKFVKDTFVDSAKGGVKSLAGDHGQIESTNRRARAEANRPVPSLFD